MTRARSCAPYQVQQFLKAGLAVALFILSQGAVDAAPADGARQLPQQVNIDGTGHKEDGGISCPDQSDAQPVNNLIVVAASVPANSITVSHPPTNEHTDKPRANSQCDLLRRVEKLEKTVDSHDFILTLMVLFLVGIPSGCLLYIGIMVVVDYVRYGL